MKKSWVGKLFRSKVDSRVVEDHHEGDDANNGKRKPGGWKCVPYIIGNETFEKVASMGLMSNFTIFLVNHFHMNQVTAAQLTNIYGGTSNFSPILGAFISDAYLGRFRTLAYTSVISFLGMAVLTMTAIVPQLVPPSCSPEQTQAGTCRGASMLQMGVLMLSLLLLSIGAGGVRPCSLPFGVDQFDKTTEEGRQGLESFFNWYYCTSTLGTVLAMTVLVYVQGNVSWGLGFGIPTVLMLVAIVFFFLGMRVYDYVPPEGSVFSGIAQVFVAAIRKRSLQLPAADDAEQQESLLYNPFTRSDRVMKLPLTLQFRWLNKAAIKCEGEVREEDGSIAKPWKLSSVQQIEEVKCLLRIIPVWAAGIICFTALAQQWSFSALQAMTMNRHLGPHFQIPPASYGMISLIALIVFIVLYDQIIVPVLRKFTGIESGITLLQRQGVGLIVSGLSMVVAGLVEQVRRGSALAHGGQSPLSAALWLSPQLVLMGIAEAFNAVGQIEFYNRQFPEHMQTLAGSLFYCSLAGAGYMSSILIAVLQKNTDWLDSDINHGRVDYLYYVIAAMGAVNFVYFLVCAHYYRYKGVPEMMIKDPSEEETKEIEMKDHHPHPSI